MTTVAHEPEAQRGVDDLLDTSPKRSPDAETTGPSSSQRAAPACRANKDKCSQFKAKCVNFFNPVFRATGERLGWCKTCGVSFKVHP